MSKILESVYDYVKEFSGLDEDFIFQGGNNSSVLPKAHNRFAVLNLLNIMQVGTNEEEYTDHGVRITSTLQASVQVDMYGDSLEEAQSAMQPLQSLFRGIVACDFFIPLGFTPLYADDVKPVFITDSSNQYVPRVTTTLYFTYKNIIEQPYDTFTSANVDVVNVDVKFKPCFGCRQNMSRTDKVSN